MILGQNLFINFKSHLCFKYLILILNSEVNVICMVATQNCKEEIDYLPTVLDLCLNNLKLFYFV